MARKKNELYIGDEFLTLEGSNVKHPSLSEYYANINVNKITNRSMDFIGIDLETNHKTSQLKLLGFCDMDNEYSYYQNNFLGIIFNKVRDAYYQKTKLVWWNKLDHFVIYKQLLNYHYKLNKDEQYIKKSLKRFGKVSGEFDKENEEWTTPPVVEVKIGPFYFGITNVIRSSIQFYFYNEFNPQRINRVWAYDIANLYLGSLSKEAKDLSYYSKVDNSAHIVNWKRFKTDKNYRENIVLKSNYFDARAVKDLAVKAINNFYKIFRYYPTSLISAGSLARAGIVADIMNYNDGDKDKTIKDLNSIPLYNYKDEWVAKYGQKTYKNIMAIFNEAYSGGYIESVAYGSVKKAYMADIASAYPSIAVDLYDLRGSKITHGKGTPPSIKNSYCFIRGDVTIPSNVDYHPITIKHPFLKDTNIRACGDFRASYTKKERDYLLTLDAKFENEEWYNIETKGVLSPLARAVRSFLKSRTELLAKGDSAQYTAKTCANSIYGILYEAIRTYKLDKDEEVVRGGYRVGEFNNPLYASIITSQVRILISKGSNAIKANGGQPIVIMTDSIFWKGDADMLPKNLWREKKTLGYFEKPEQVNDMVCLGAGRYEYYTTGTKIKYQGKKRGLNIVDLHNKDGTVLENFNWSALTDKVLKTNIYVKQELEKNNLISVNNLAKIFDMKILEIEKLLKQRKILCKNNMIISKSALDFWNGNLSSNAKVVVRILVSVGLVAHQDKYTHLDLGLVKEEVRDVEIIVGHTKRVIPSYKIEDLKNGLIITKPLLLTYKDHTLNKLREKMMKLEVLTQKQKDAYVSVKTSKNYAQSHKKKINLRRKEKYKKLLELGLTPEEARKNRDKSIKKIEKNLNKT